MSISRCCSVALLCIVVLSASVGAIAPEALSNSGQSNFTVSGRKILRNGGFYYVKGINYSPVAAGGSNMDITIDAMAPAHERDMALLRAAYVNTIRVYGMTPDTDANTYSHQSFLDICWNNGSNPVHVIVTAPVSTTFTYLFNVNPSTPGAFQIDGGQWLSPDPSNAQNLAAQQQQTESDLRNLLSHYGSHSAVIGFAMGNELNNYMVRSDPAFWQFIDNMHGIVKEMAPGKLTFTAVADDSMITVNGATGTQHPPSNAKDMPNLDVWGINSYRGSSTQGFGDDFFTSFAQISAKPLLATEFGSPASTRTADMQVVEMPNNASGQADYFEAHWMDIVRHRNISAGGLVFVWSDEWWKAGTPLVHDALNNANPSFPGGWWDEEWFGICGINPSGDVNTPWQQRGPDQMQPRDAYARMQQLYA